MNNRLNDFFKTAIDAICMAEIQHVRDTKALSAERDKLKAEVEALRKQQSGWISVEDGLPEIAEGKKLQVAVCVRRKDGKQHVFAAQYLNKYPLYSEDDEDGMLLSTGWYDVTYSPLTYGVITHWQPLPDAPQGDE